MQFLIKDITNPWLIGDVYKKLSFEGSSLTSPMIADELEKSRRYLKEIS